MANYLEERELYYEITLSKGKGKLTPRSEELLLLIVKHLSYVFKHRFPARFSDEYNDSIQTAALHLLTQWDKVNLKKYDKILPYLTELAKRAMFKSHNQQLNKKDSQTIRPKYINIDLFIEPTRRYDR